MNNLYLSCSDEFAICNNIKNLSTRIHKLKKKIIYK